MTRKPFRTDTANKAIDTLDLIHTDICGLMQTIDSYRYRCGLMQTIAPGGKRYTVTVIDDYGLFVNV